MRKRDGTFNSIGREIRLSKAANDFAGSNLSIICEQAIQVQMGRAMSLEEYQNRVRGNLNNLNTFLAPAEKRALSKSEFQSAQEMLVKLRQMAENLEGNAICRK
ncbi:MAG: hypothetical protein WC488_05205 [Candidatus Micrarchaeia archaeon]